MHPALRTLTLGATLALVASGTVLTSVASGATPTATTACSGLTPEHEVGSENIVNGLAFEFGRDHTWSGRVGGFDLMAEDETITNNTGRTIQNAKLVIADIRMFRNVAAANGGNQGGSGAGAYYDNSDHHFRVDSTLAGYDGTIEGADSTNPGYDAYLYAASDAAPFDYETISSNGIVTDETLDSLGETVRQGTDAVPTMAIGDLAPGASVTKPGTTPSSSVSAGRGTAVRGSVSTAVWPAR